jgi:hypothetical protein
VCVCVCVCNCSIQYHLSMNCGDISSPSSASVWDGFLCSSLLYSHLWSLSHSCITLMWTCQWMNMNSHFHTTIYDKTERCIANYPFMSSNIPSRPTHGIYISQLIRIGRICSSYEEFVKRNMLFTRQGFLHSKLVTSFKTFNHWQIWYLSE